MGKKKKSSKSFTAVNEVTVCLVTKELFNDVEFQPAKTFIIADILIKAEEVVVRGLRTRKSLIRFNSQDLECSSRTSVSVSQKSGMIRQGSGISRQGSVNSRQSSAFSRQGSSVRSFDGETKDNESTDTETNYFNNDGMRVSRDEVDDLPSMILCGLSIDVCGCSSGNSNGNGNGSGAGTGSLSFR